MKSIILRNDTFLPKGGRGKIGTLEVYDTSKRCVTVDSRTNDLSDIYKEMINQDPNLDDVCRKLDMNDWLSVCIGPSLEDENNHYYNVLDAPAKLVNKGPEVLNQLATFIAPFTRRGEEDNRGYNSDGYDNPNDWCFMTELNIKSNTDGSVVIDWLYENETDIRIKVPDINKWDNFELERKLCNGMTRSDISLFMSMISRLINSSFSYLNSKVPEGIVLDHICAYIPVESGISSNKVCINVGVGIRTKAVNLFYDSDITPGSYSLVYACGLSE